MVQICVLCLSGERDELIFGTVHVEGNMMVHRNCLYLSSNLIQRGEKKLSIMNFLKEDIEAEVNRCRLLKCCYCRRLGANIWCCKSGCRRTFHTKCGVDNLAQNQFCDTYNSFCHQHVLVPRNRPVFKNDEECLLCAEDVVAKGERFSVVTCLYAPCCRNGWFHRRCLQRYANSSGYFFKCPLCNNTDVFRRVAYMGIAVLDQDASWETEPDAFAGQYRRDVNCTAALCVAVSGRADTSAMLLYCTSCGANPSHYLCTLKTLQNYVCKVCSAVSPEAVPVAESDSDDAGSMDDSAEAPRPGHLNGDQIQEKLSPSHWDDFGSSDDDAVFQRAFDTKVQSRVVTLSDDQPSTSAGARALADRGTRTFESQGTQTTFLSSVVTSFRSATATATSSTSTSTSTSASTLDNQENTEPSTSNGRRPWRPRYVSPPRHVSDSDDDSDEYDSDEYESKRRQLTPTAAAPSNGRRLLGSISPEPSTPAPRVLRRRTLANRPSSLANMDISCVANRTRHRLSNHMASRKD
uniref:LD43541p n=1 Tax=Drosophila melanogaster TaxID=7227 RepID=Q9W5W9_DROME|eukprot:NP_001259740.1 PHD finger protein 7, isoform B [Drosophila melanogaster]